MDPTAPLLERDTELAHATSAFESALRGDGRAVLVSGPAGIGKTSLIESIKDRAFGRDVTVLSARGSELEGDFPFGIVRQLFERHVTRASLDARAKLLSGQAAFAGFVLGITGEDRAAATDPGFQTVHGLYWLTVNLAEEAPLVIVIDDLHWADRDSLRFLTYLAGRLEGLELLLLMGLRDPDPSTEESLIAALAHETATIDLRPAPLSFDGLRTMISATLGGDPGDRFLDGFGAATGGNPFLAAELLSALAAEGISPADAEASEALAELGPHSIASFVLVRLARLDPACVALAQSLCILGDGAPRSDIVAVSGLSEDEVDAAVAQLIAIAVLNDARALEFVHPVVRQSIYTDMSRIVRSERHRLAATVLIGRGADATRVATQVMAADPGVGRPAVAKLQEAATSALRDGAGGAAVQYLKRALEESPDDGERARILQSLGLAEFQRGDLPSASAALSQAIELIEDPEQQVGLMRVLAGVQLISGRAVDAVQLLDEGISLLPEDAESLGLELEADLARAGQFRIEARRLTQARSPRFSPRDGIAQPPITLATSAMERVFFGPSASAAVGLAERALADGRLLTEQSADSQTFYMAANALLLAGELRAAHRVYTDAIQDARERGSLLGFRFASCYRAVTSLGLGSLREAEADARSALEPDPASLGVLGPVARAALGSAVLDQGDLDAARNALAVGDVPESAEEPVFFTHFLHARARLRLEEGDPRRALADAEACGRSEAAWGIKTPALTPWRATAALARHRLGDRAGAKELIALELPRVRAFGVARWIGNALATAAVIEGGADAVELSGESVEVLAGSSARLLHARSLVGLGAALRREGHRRDAREPLREGLALARRCGALTLAEHAHEELEATGARPRRILRIGVEELTGSELRVAQMAAEGMSNKEIAQARFVTVHTVQTHLHRAYRKLDVTSRRDLPAALEPR